MYGQLSLDETLTLQAGSSVPATLLSAEIFHIHVTDKKIRILNTKRCIIIAKFLLIILMKQTKTYYLDVLVFLVSKKKIDIINKKRPKIKNELMFFIWSRL